MKFSTARNKISINVQYKSFGREWSIPTISQDEQIYDVIVYNDKSLIAVNNPLVRQLPQNHRFLPYTWKCKNTYSALDKHKSMI